METLYLFNENKDKKDYTEDIINDWINRNASQGEYELVVIEDTKDINNGDTILFNRNIDERCLQETKELIDGVNDISMCFLVSPKDISKIEGLNNLTSNNVNVGTILKPIQYSKINEFMNSAINRKKPVIFKDDSDCFDINEFL